MTRQEAEERPLEFLDERLGTNVLLRKALRYVFPDHWSFMLGELALYAFMVLIATGAQLPRGVDDDRQLRQLAPGRA